MFGQIGPLQIDTSMTAGSQIVTPPKSYVTVFWHSNAGTMTLYCKDSTGVSHAVTAGGDPVVCVAPIG